MAKRFEAEHDEDIGIIYRQSPTGPYVSYADYARLEEALRAMLKEHDILSGNYGDVMDPRHARPDRWPTAAAMARAALNTGEDG